MYFSAACLRERETLLYTPTIRYFDAVIRSLIFCILFFVDNIMWPSAVNLNNKQINAKRMNILVYQQRSGIYLSHNCGERWWILKKHECIQRSSFYVHFAIRLKGCAARILWKIIKENVFVFQNSTTQSVSSHKCHNFTGVFLGSYRMKHKKSYGMGLSAHPMRYRVF